MRRAAEILTSLSLFCFLGWDQVQKNNHWAEFNGHFHKTPEEAATDNKTWSELNTRQKPTYDTRGKQTCWAWGEARWRMKAQRGDQKMKPSRDPWKEHLLFSGGESRDGTWRRWSTSEAERRPWRRRRLGNPVRAVWRLKGSDLEGFTCSGSFLHERSLSLITNTCEATLVKNVYKWRTWTRRLRGQLTVHHLNMVTWSEDDRQGYY